MTKQLAAWNNGDHEGFMQGYWKSDSIRFCTSNGVLHGWDAMLNMYRKGFPSPAQMGHLDFIVDSIYADRYPQLWVNGQWIVEATDTSSGRFVLVFENKEGQWLITEDHTW